MKHDVKFDGRPIRLSVTTTTKCLDEAMNERLKLNYIISIWVFFPTLEHKAFKMHSKVGDLRAQPQHDHPAKLVVTETAVLNSVCASVPSHSGGTDPSTGCTDHSAGQAHSRGEERVSGSSLQNGQDSAHRMDPPPLCVRSTMHGMGHPQPGPVCNPPQQQASSVCVSHGRPTSRGCRCHVNVMEGNVCLLLCA